MKLLFPNMPGKLSVETVVLPGLFACELSAQVPFVPKDPYGEEPSKAWTYVPNAGQGFDLDGNFRPTSVGHGLKRGRPWYSIR